MAVKDELIHVVFLVIYARLVNSARLNVGGVLLPYNQGVPTNYTLEVTEGGCYKWISSRHEVISITPIEENVDRMCSTKAILSAVSSYHDRHSVIVLAIDENIGLTLRCDVTVDVIHSIEIVTTTREIFLEDAPVAFEVQAKNDQGDTFSCLDGVAFEWIITDPSGRQAENKVLRFLKYADSVYETPPAIDFWEQQGLHGYKILLEGVKTGTAKASVRPRDSTYKDIQSSEITLIVVANMVLNPACDIYILPETTIQYQVELIKQRKAHVIPMPSNQYYLELSNPDVATLDSQTSTVTGIKYGFTQIVLKDKNIKLEEMLHQPSAGIHVIYPSYILFRVTPGYKWFLQELLSYVVTVEIYDAKNHKIYLSDNLWVQVTFPSKYFHVMYSSLNGTYHVVQTLVPGTTKIQGEVKGMKKDDKMVKIESPVSGYQETTIFQAVCVLPSSVLLPWDPLTQPKYYITLKATGGTGSYKWLSSNNSIAKVNYEEHLDKVLIIGHNLGDANITAIDLLNPLFTDYSKISIQPVAGIDILPGIVETEIGKELVLHLAFYGYEGEGRRKTIFHNCSQIPINVEVDTTKFVFNEAANVVSTVSCRGLQFTCRAVGYSTVKVYYNSGEETLNATTTIACHKLLQPVYPVRVAVLALGSSVEVAFEGGPNPWPLYQQGHYVKIKTDSSRVIDSISLESSFHFTNVYVSRVTCRHIGDAVINVTIGNSPSPSNLHPVEHHASVKIVCAIPKSIQLIPKLKEPKARKYSCPLSDSDTKLPVHCYQDLDIELWIKDDIGRKFLNISSLNIHWELSDNNLAKLDNPSGIVIEIMNETGYRKVHRNLQKLHPYGKEGLLKVTAEVSGYKQDILYKEYINIQSNIEPSVHQSVMLDLVDDADIIPDKLSVFNHPSNRVYLKVVRGSGHFYVDSSDEKRARIRYDKTTRQIEVIPVEDGSISLSVHDVCLEVRQVAASQIQISGISSIRVHMIDKVELGKSFAAAIEILDGEGRLLPSSLYSLINLKPVLSSNIISVKLQIPSDANQYQATCVITGLSLGHTSLIFTAGAASSENGTVGKSTSSETFPVQVFPPLHVEPRNVTLIVGATFQVTCSGGPQPQSNVEYTISEQGIAEVTSAGIITATKLGKTVLTAKAIGHDRKIGQSVVYSQDQVIVHVVLLQRIKIKAPLTRMEAATKMPAYAVGLLEQEIPFAFGSALPELTVKWSVTNENIVQLHNVYDENGIQESNKNNFAVRVHAKQAGHVTLHLELSSKTAASGTTMQTIKNFRLSDEVQIEVYEKLKLTMPEIDGSKILMSPHSQKKLLSNRDGIARLTYTILPLVTGQNPDVTIDNTGLLKTSSKTGVVQVLITAHEDFDIKQWLSVLIEVKIVSYMMINADITVRTDAWPLAVIPLGLTMILRVDFHDDIGRKFHALNAQLKFRPSRFDLVQISQGVQNRTLKVQALKPGTTVLKVWDPKNSHIVDYINMIVGTAIDPIDPSLTLGDIVCYSSPLITQEGQHGSWFSTNNVMTVHPTTGISIAQQIGTDTIHYNVSNVIVTSTQVNVKPVTVIIIDQSAVKHISNVKREKPYIIPVLLKSESSQRILNLLGKNCSKDVMDSISSILYQFPFACELSLIKPNVDISATEIFEASAGFDWEKGLYHCAISPINKASLHDISTLHTEVVLNVQLIQPTAMHTVQSTAMARAETVSLPFFPAFHVYIEELILSNIQPVGTIAISAIPSVQECLTIIPSDSNILEVHLPKIDASHPQTVMFPVAIRDISSLWQVDVLIMSLDIEVSCSLTKQSHTVPVKLKLIGQKDGMQCPPMTYSTVGWKSMAQVVWENYQSFMVTTLSVIGTIAALFIGYRALINSRSQPVGSSQPSVFLHSLGEASSSLPYSPWRSSPQSTGRPQLWSRDNSYRTSDRQSPQLRTLHSSQ